MVAGGAAMIVRIPGEGQWEIHGEMLDDLDRCDQALIQALHDADASGFEAAIGEMTRSVRTHGRRLSPEELVESDLVLPPADATLEEIEPLFVNEAVLVA